MIHIRRESGSEVVVLTIDGALTADHVSELKEFLIKALTNAEHLVFNFEKVTEVSPHCFQVLCLAHKIAEKLNKHLVLNGGLPAVFLRAAATAGCDRRNGCNRKNSSPCLLTGNSKG